MLFFNKKEEVIDVQLTQYGKHLLSRGSFKPVYYCFFDDDILYDSSKAGFTEHQNDTEVRILEQTPKLKVQHLSYGLKTFNIAGSAGGKNSEITARESVYFDFNLKNKDLLYKLANQEVVNQEAPSYNVLFLDSLVADTGSVEYQHFTNSGILLNVPQLSSSVGFQLVKDVTNISEKRRISSEDNYDMSSGKIVFSDNSNLHITKSSLVVDIEESNVFDGKQNFFLEIYEEEGSAFGAPILRKIEDMEELNYLFHIKTDESIDSEVFEYKNKKQKNNKKRQD